MGSGIRKALALAWALIILACGAYLAWRLPSASIESSIFALLPERERDPSVREAGSALRTELERRFLVLVAAPSSGEATRAAEAYADALRKSGTMREVLCAVPESGAGRMLDFYEPHRFALLSAEDRLALERDSNGLYEAAQRTLYLPPGVSGSLGFGKDPFGTWGRWLASRSAAGAGLALEHGHLAAVVDGEPAIAVLGTLGPRGRGSEAQDRLAAAFDGAAAAAESSAASGRDDAETSARPTLLRSGFVFHELLAARQAHREMTSIGTVSAVLLLVLMLLAFRGIRPTLLGFLPVVIGCLAATALLLLTGGGKVHLIAMVFGSTIVGVAEDYGMLFIAGLYEDKPWDGRRRLLDVQRSIFLGLLTSVMGYLALFFVPIPGLRQIGLFSIAGLVASWATVMLWYPWLGARLKPVSAGVRHAAGAIERGWPKVREGYATRLILLGLLGLSAWGCARMRVDDDVRLLYAHDERLQREQDKIGSVLRLPGGSRFFLVRGRHEQEALEREEKLLAALAAADPAGATAVAVSVFVPSRARQESDAALLRSSLDGAARAGKRLADDLGAPELADSLRLALRRESRPVTVAEWLADPVSTPFRYLVRGAREGGGADAYATVVPVPAAVRLDLAGLRALAQGAGPGVVVVDQIQEVTDTLAFLRRHLVWVLCIGSGIVLGALILLFRNRAWGAAAPAALGVAAGLGSLGWSGLPVNLFALLALALILGMGIDYGIFVQESRRDGAARAAALVAINMGAASNMLAFGMLVFSTTPALRAFGLVLAVGLGVAWLTAPCFAVLPGEEPEGMGHGA
ncbi:MAG TPA: MMPL family transporter [Fibrobacteria bacterium]|nr:MMPL family transporter [Fibrobacteria bacterium]